VSSTDTPLENHATTRGPSPTGPADAASKAGHVLARMDARLSVDEIRGSLREVLAARRDHLGC
jgi:hypothetical protein